MNIKYILYVSLAVIAACSDADSPPPAAAPAADAGPAQEVSIYGEAVASPGRTVADRERDAGRKPAEVLEFFGITPGMAVLDMFSGGGYYTEMLSFVVGPDGSVVAHNNQAYTSFVGDEAAARYADDRLANVELLMAENNELSLPSEEFDAVMLILAYHDIYFVDPNNGWPKIDGPAFVAELKQSLKPGGILAVVDHYAEAGSPRETGGTLHRIDPEIVIAELEDAGFRLEAKSQVLRNMDDDYSKAMFDPEVRSKTDRFVLRFRKAE